MPSREFGFSLERKRILIDLLSRAKPRLPSDRIKFFLSEVVREINICLRYYPEGWPQDEQAPKRIETVRKAALSLHAALTTLNEAQRLALFAGLLVGHDSGCDIREVRAEAREMESSLMKLHEEAAHLCYGPGTPASDRFAEDVAYSLAVSYVVAFGRLPSLRHDSAYKIFVEDVTANDLPDGFRASIGKHKMELANKRALVHLECMQLNKTVTETASKTKKPSTV